MVHALLAVAGLSLAAGASPAVAAPRPGSAAGDGGGAKDAPRAPQAPRDGLVAWFPFDGDAADASGNGHHGTAIDTNLDRDVAGARRGSMRFNDDDDRISLPIDVNPHTFPRVTLCAWVFSKSYRKELIVLSNDDGGGDRKLYTVKKDSDRVWAVSDGRGGFIGETVVEPRRWAFVAVRYDQAREIASISVDGKVTSGKAKVDVGAETLWVGARKSEGSEAEALIDEVYVYDRLLTDQELATIRALKTPPPPVARPDPALAYQASQTIPVRARPDEGAAQVALLQKGAILGAAAVALAAPQGGPGQGWYALTLADGKAGFAPMKYFERKKGEAADKDQSALLKVLEEHFGPNKLLYWVALLGALLLGIAGAFAFPFLDRALGWVTGSDYSNVGWLPLAGALCGCLLALPTVFAQDSVEYYLLENFTLWPDGYGFGTWLAWGVVMLALVAVALQAFESFAGAGLVHGSVRLGLQGALALATFLSSLILSCMLVVIAIVGFVALILVGGAASSMIAEGMKRIVVIHR